MSLRPSPPARGKYHLGGPSTPTPVRNPEEDSLIYFESELEASSRWSMFNLLLGLRLLRNLLEDGQGLDDVIWILLYTCSIAMLFYFYFAAKHTPLN
nr:hypothetical protein [Tanacetum cinerariifolium]